MLSSDIDNTVPGGTSSPGAQQSTAPPSIYDLEKFKTELGASAIRAKNLTDPFKELEASGERLTETFGFAGERLREMETQINRSATGILEVSKRAMTYEQALKRAGEIVNEVATITSRNVIASTEVIKGLELTSEATGVSTKDLAEKFSDVGFQLTDVKTQMEIAAKTAQKLGVNVSAVAKEVTANLGKMNVYNFQNGVEGLARMAAKSTVLGVEMQKVFDLAERAFDPEKAINLAADMQRLGVATSDLLDPLKIMDLGQNNPEELMKQVVNVTKGLTQLDEASGKVRILPGEQGRLRELAEAMGMSKEELAKMAIKAGELEYKMGKISFPTLKAPISEDDREMIANLAQFSTDKKGFVVDVQGEQRLVSELSEPDIKLLKEQAQPKTIEELAKDQLTVSQKMLKQMELFNSAPRAGLSRTKGAGEMKTTMDAIADASMEASFKKTKNLETGKDEDIHDVAERTLGTIGDDLAKLPLDIAGTIKEALSKGDIEGAKNAFDKLGTTMTELGAKAITNSIEFTTGAYKRVSDALGAAMTTFKTGEKPKTTTSSTETKSEPSLNWHETLDKTMESYKKSMEPKTITTPTEKTLEQIEEEKQKQDTEAMEDLFSSFVEKTGTPVIDMKPLIENGMAQNDRLIEKLDELIAAVNENKLAIDYDKLGVNVNEDTEYTNLFEPMINKFSELISSQRETISALEKIKSIDFTKQIEIPEKIEEPLIVENKVETPPITETPKIEITNEPFNLPEPLNMDDILTSFNDLGEKFKFPSTDFSPIMDRYGFETDKILDKFTTLIEATEENRLDIDYDKFKTEKTDNIDYTSIFESNLKPINQILTEFQKNNEPKSVNPTIVEKLETKEIEKQPIVELKKEKTPEPSTIEVRTQPYKIPEPTDNKDVIASLNGLGEQLKFPTTDLSPLVSEYGLQTDKLINTLVGIREDTKENKFSIDYDKFTSGKNEENYSEIFEPTMNKLGQFISEQERIFGVKTPEPSKIEKTELIKETTKEIEVPRQEIKQPEILIKPEYELANNAPIGVQNIKESNLPESAKTTIPEITPQTMKTESTTNVGGEITLVVDVRGVQNDASRLIIDEVTKKINSGEFTTALISQIKNKESAYGQLSGNQYSTPPGFI